MRYPLILHRCEIEAFVVAFCPAVRIPIAHSLFSPLHMPDISYIGYYTPFQEADNAMGGDDHLLSGAFAPAFVKSELWLVDELNLIGTKSKIENGTRITIEGGAGPKLRTELGSKTKRSSGREGGEPAFSSFHALIFQVASKRRAIVTCRGFHCFVHNGYADKGDCTHPPAKHMQLIEVYLFARLKRMDLKFSVPIGPLRDGDCRSREHVTCYGNPNKACAYIYMHFEVQSKRPVLGRREVALPASVTNPTVLTVDLLFSH
ncbi:hypothetical protein EVAR_45405_1 [Eumeta japonica]|uniref:Uncharacterized protein n=1 Tax=Eumeta variegata TaxID=151549 RepID=A0A4C1WSI8_EUMVA|nr:hypothetical protein EVAR_45405_1 [Eumeta japonica]